MSPAFLPALLFILGGAPRKRTSSSARPRRPPRPLPCACGCASAPSTTLSATSADPQQKELPEETYDKVLKFSESGDALAKKGRFKEATAEYNEAWQLLPKPKGEWKASTRLLAAIIDAAFLGGYFKTARQAALRWRFHMRPAR